MKANIICPLRPSRQLREGSSTININVLHGSGALSKRAHIYRPTRPIDCRTILREKRPAAACHAVTQPGQPKPYCMWIWARLHSGTRQDNPA